MCSYSSDYDFFPLSFKCCDFCCCRQYISFCLNTFNFIWDFFFILSHNSSVDNIFIRMYFLSWLCNYQFLRNDILHLCNAADQPNYIYFLIVILKHWSQTSNSDLFFWVIIIFSVLVINYTGWYHTTWDDSATAASVMSLSVTGI